ncbi:site-specific DNA-methyltransferase [Candidatus Peregrinibacteria bacterium]|nr:site-specific DNA-methyltransferase [Candidatus Peregrinibacteria bacterium]
MPSFHFKGKTFLQNYHHAVKFHNLVTQKTKGLSKSPSLDDNLIIHGDNLKALKALLPTHAGKIKCIYIDPPYNTGNENWIYNDNVASPMIREWLGKVVARDDLTRHDKWACMMYPRLTLLRELLKDDGIIFISIDDNEFHHLRSMLDEIFGEDNFIADFLWKKKATSTNVKEASVSSLVDYTLVYGKSGNAKLLQRIRSKETREYPHKDKLGNYRLTIIEKKNAGSYARATMQFEILGKKPRAGKRWQIGEKKARGLEANGRFIIDGNVIKLKIYDFEDVDTYSSQPNLLDDHGSTDSAQSMLTEIFGEPEIFDNPKPIELIYHLISISSTKDDVILDSFAGSGTTGHAVLALNKEDDGNRQFILVECEDYADKITAERMRRVIKGIPNAADEALKSGLGGSFSFYELGEEINMEHLLECRKLPSFEDLSKYAFFTATGEKFNAKKLNEKTFHIGSSSTFEVFLIYSPDKKKLKEMALNLDFAERIHKQFPARQKLVFAPACFMEDYHLKEFNIRFAQLPFEIYRMAE